MYKLVWDELPLLYSELRFDYERTLIRVGPTPTPVPRTLTLTLTLSGTLTLT